MQDIKNIKDLRESLTQHYSLMKDGNFPVAAGKELAYMAGKILASCRVELDYNSAMGYSKKIDFLEVENG